MKHVAKTVAIELEEVVIHAGECLTVWLEGDDPLKRIHVELRVMPNGNKELYCDDNIIKPFDKWYGDTA